MVHVCVGVFPLSPCTALIRGMLIIAWPHGCPSSRGEEAETGDGCWEVRQHPAASHLSCHLCYASHGIQCARPVDDKAGCSQLSQTRTSPPLLIGLDLNTMWMNETFVQIIRTRRSGDEEPRCRVRNMSVYSCRCWRLIFTALFAQACVRSLYVNALGMIHTHTFIRFLSLRILFLSVGGHESCRSAVPLFLSSIISAHTVRATSYSAVNVITSTFLHTLYYIESRVSLHILDFSPS